MKLLVVLCAVCLAFLLQGAETQDNGTAVIDTGSNNATSSDNSTSEASNATSPDNSTAEASNAKSPDNSTAAGGNNTAAEGDTDSILERAPNNLTAAFGNDSASNVTEANNGSVTNNAPPAGSNNAQPIQFQNASEADMTMFGLSTECADIVKNCYVQNSSAEFKQFLYCEAYKKSSGCVAENVTTGNDTEVCGVPDRTILEVFACGPAEMGLNVAPRCKARLTECATGFVTPAEKLAGVNDTLFESKVCQTLKTAGCLNMANDGAVCTPMEITKITAEADCSGTAGLLSSILLLALMFVVTKVM